MISHAIPEVEDAPLDVAEQSRTILIVDDDADQAFCLARRLESQGFLTVTAHRGLLGLGLAQADRPDLILLDVRLPDIDGLEVCRGLADSPVTCHIPVIIVSGMERNDIVRRARAAGCAFFIRKPYDPNALLTLIQASMEYGS